METARDTGIIDACASISTSACDKDSRSAVIRMH
jgi:hypothetical protein